MALLMTILTVAAMLGGMTLLLWLSAHFESRHLGPLTAGDEAQLAEPAVAAVSIVEAVQTAA